MTVQQSTICAALLACLWAAPAHAAEKARVIVLNLAHSDPSLELLARSLSEQVVTELARAPRVQAIGQADLGAVLGLEREKQLLGCSEEATSCLAEVSAALGAPWLVSGSLARLGSSVRIDLKLIRTSDGMALFRDGRTTEQDGQVFNLLASMVAALLVKGGFTDEGPRTSSGAGSSVPPLLTLGAGGAALVAGAIITGLAGGQWQNLNDATWKAKTSWVEVKSTGDSFNTGIVLGPILLGAGVVAATAGLLWRLLLKPEPAVSFLLTGNGIALGGLF